MAGLKELEAKEPKDATSLCFSSLVQLDSV